MERALKSVCLPLDGHLLDLKELGALGYVQVVITEEELVILALYLVCVHAHPVGLVPRDKTIPQKCENL